MVELNEQLQTVENERNIERKMRIAYERKKIELKKEIKRMKKTENTKQR